jgi:hypothetical protein
MPESFTFCGCTAANFPESRDAHADIVGYTEPGAEREFDAPFGAEAPKDPAERAWWFPAPTADWFASDGELPKRLADPEPEDEPETPAEPVATPAPAVSFPPRPAAITPPASPADEHEA